jgi:hypothetical protein
MFPSLDFKFKNPMKQNSRIGAHIALHRIFNPDPPLAPILEGSGPVYDFSFNRDTHLAPCIKLSRLGIIRNYVHLMASLLLRSDIILGDDWHSKTPCH